MSGTEVVVITGAATGLGRATALKMAEKGYRLTLVDFNEEAGQETLKDVQATGAEAIFVKANVSVEEDVKAYVEKTVEAFGAINHFVNNAGIMVPMRLLHEYDVDEYNRVMDVNVKGAFLGLKYVIAVMMENGGGHIVNTVSSNSYKPTAYNGLYSATKHALAALTKSIGQDYQDYKIYAAGVAPNSMNTTISAAAVPSLTPDRLENLSSSTGPNRPASPEEIADVVMFILESGAPLVNGTIVNCAGGQIYN